MPILSNFPVGKTGSQYYGTCSTAASTAAKVVTLSDKSFALKAGVNVRIKFTAGNSAASPTLNVNGTGAKSIKIYGTTAVTGWNNNTILDFTYDGTYWMLQNANLATTGTYGITKLESSVNSTSNSLAATPSAVKQAYDKAVAALEKPIQTIITLAAAGWTETKTYSFEDVYPNTTYNLKISPSSTCTKAQLEAYDDAFMIGEDEVNVVKAYGVVPATDIPIKVEVYKK